MILKFCCFFAGNHTDKKTTKKQKNKKATKYKYRTPFTGYVINMQIQVFSVINVNKSLKLKVHGNIGLL